MEDIKYKALKRTHFTDKWIKGYYALEDGEHCIILPHMNSYEKALKEKKPLPALSVRHEIDYNTLCEYTGVDDDYGEEIYNRDIVTVEKTHIFAQSEIIKENGCFFVKSKDKDDKLALYIIKEHGYKIKVTGNVHN